jgi:hypothetical protein
VAGFDTLPLPYASNDNNENIAEFDLYCGRCFEVVWKKRNDLTITKHIID